MINSQFLNTTLVKNKTVFQKIKAAKFNMKYYTTLEFNGQVRS